MGLGAEEKWVNIKLRRHLTRRNIQTFRKCVTFFAVAISTLFLVNSAYAEEVFFPPESEGAITVLATVPLTQEFTYSIRRNSSLSITKAAFVIGEEVFARVKIVGGKHEFLRKHKVRLYGENEEREVVVTLDGETDENGEVEFNFTVNGLFLGTTLVRAIDVTYDTSILLDEKLSLLTYQEESNKKQQYRAIKTDISGNEESVLGEIILDEKKEKTDGIFQDSGTIVTRYSRNTSPRASPLSLQ